jgi:negative regulator of sigma-B (phosphoserine phosphatase)
MIEQFRFETHTFSAFQKPKIQHNACGDSYWLKETDEELICVIADGLGSGDQAQLASKAAVETVQHFETESVREIVHRVNEVQKNFRGVVLSIVKYNKKTEWLEYCGVGNISLKIVLGPNMVLQPRPKNGFLSGRPLDLEVQQLKMPRTSWFAMYSDGISLQVKKLDMLYNIFANCTYREINDYLAMEPLNSIKPDDITIIIGKPN